MRRTAAAVAIVGALVALAACSDSDDGDTAAETEASAPPATAPPGLPDFYAVPDPLPAGEPGDVIATEEVDAPGLHGTLLRVMYHSESLSGDDVAVTGLVAVPDSPPPDDGYPVISWAHGTTGIADVCAPSLEPGGYEALANGLLDAGYVVAGTDYEGLGTPGRHPYIVGESEARGTIDIVRAVHNLDDVPASTRYAVWGHSQGGHAAMYALHTAADWAPELDLVGVVAGAPPSQLGLLYAALRDSPFRHYLLMAAAGFNAGHGDEDAPLDKVLTEEGLAATAHVDEGCDVAGATADLDTDSLILADPNDVPEWARLLEANDPGKFTEPSEAPLLIIHGGQDEQIPVVASQLMFDQLCAIGQAQQRWVYPGQSHAGVIGPSFADMLAWIDNRFAGEPAPDPVAPTGQPDVETQACPT
jgi:alpha-beta hydrolase superfamily lysophospholipase